MCHELPLFSVSMHCWMIVTLKYINHLKLAVFDYELCSQFIIKFIEISASNASWARLWKTVSLYIRGWPRLHWHNEWYQKLCWYFCLDPDEHRYLWECACVAQIKGRCHAQWGSLVDDLVRASLLKNYFYADVPCIVHRYWLSMMTSSNGNISRVTSILCGEFTGQRSIPPHKDQWRGTLMFSLICAWISGWVNNREAGDLKRHPAHYDVIVMQQ